LLAGNTANLPAEWHGLPLAAAVLHGLRPVVSTSLGRLSFDLSASPAVLARPSTLFLSHPTDSGPWKLLRCMRVDIIAIWAMTLVVATANNALHCTALHCLSERRFPLLLQCRSPF
jgi:hypothetical protein